MPHSSAMLASLIRFPAAEFSVTDTLADEVDDLFAVCRFIKLLHRSP